MKTEDRHSPKVELGPIRSKSLPETVAEQLRDAIIGRRLRPGERLVEQKLAALFGIGQPTIREALKLLEHQGFVHKLPNRASYVTQLSKADVEKMFEVRMALETLAIEKATRNLRPSTLKELHRCLGEMDQAAQQVNLSAFHQCDISFHRVIWELTGNEHLGAALDRVAFVLFAFVLLNHPQSKESYTGSVEQHRRIVEGLATKDPVAASRIFQETTAGYWREYRHIEVGPAGADVDISNGQARITAAG